ncbi:unnamed protein product [Triticum turgidum subsp. durum]|uniref:Glycosyltransferase n=1 Tax=Triticum turgidum subsp. durum TaxID=4567 RepID=A0A9R0WFT9_TRITD|nr:unnamed protein product [Triticum turgidum subsp. durum]
MAAPLWPRANESGGWPEQGGAGPGARRLATALLFLAAVALPCLVLYRAVAPGGVLVQPAARLPWLQAGAPPHDDDDVDLVQESESEDVRLERVLRAAAMANDTVILTTLNSAWAEPGSMVDVFLESFRLGEHTRELLDHLVIVSLDLAAHRRCKQIHPHCLAVATEGVDFSGQKNFMTDGYLRMMWRRIDFLRQVLEKGYSFIFTDTDIVWLRSPLPRLYAEGNFQIACDHFTGDPDDVLGNAPNGGFAYARANTETVELYRYWYAARERHPGLHDQDVLNLIKADRYLAEVGVRIRFLSTEFFGGLCEPSRNLSAVCTMHANCCVGLRRKIADLTLILHDWRSFMSLRGPDKRSAASWSVPRNCRLDKVEE